jgi:hypothetical protein
VLLQPDSVTEVVNPVGAAVLSEPVQPQQLPGSLFNWQHADTVDVSVAAAPSTAEHPAAAARVAAAAAGGTQHVDAPAIAPAAAAAAEGGTDPTLLDADSLEQHLQQLLMTRLQQQLSADDFGDLLDGLREAFDPFTNGSTDAAQQAKLLQRLRRKYVYAQAAVGTGDVDRIVAALRSLVQIRG